MKFIHIPPEELPGYVLKGHVRVFLPTPCPPSRSLPREARAHDALSAGRNPYRGIPLSERELLKP